MFGFLLRGKNWCKRFRKRCGYGVHSPSDFFLITFVIYEKLPFYAYERLKMARKLSSAKPEHREKVDRLLFRLVNYLQPEFMLEIGTGSGVSTAYIAEGNKKMKVVSFSDNLCHVCGEDCGCRNDIVYYDTGIGGFEAMLDEAAEKPDFIHIGNTCDYRRAFDAALRVASSNTCVVISLPYSDKEKKRWWKSVIEDKRTGVTFDLYDVGFVFFDHKRVKEHRVVNFL